MENTQLVPVSTFCMHHRVELSFIESLQQYGLLEITTIEQQLFFSENQLSEVERFTRLHYDLAINLEGIEAIAHLLEKIKMVQDRNRQLQNRLGLYESSASEI